MKLQALEPGDVICDQCNGTGKPNWNKVEDTWWVPKVCDKCNGSGKLDWIENITGRKKPIIFSAKWELDEYAISDQYNSFQQEIINETTKAMSVSIDKDIIKSITGKSKWK